MDARGLEATERVSASRNLGEAEARAILKASRKLVVSKGKSVKEWDVSKAVPAEAVAAMLGRTGNLRAPLLRVGKTVLVGFNEDAYVKLLG